MSIPHLAQREDQQRLEWIGGSVFSVLLDAEATGGKLTVGRLDAGLGEAPPWHMHNNEDEVFLLLAGSALVWAGDEEHELREGGIVFLPRRIPHSYRITSERADLVLISTPGGLETMFRHAGRDLRDPRPDGFEIPLSLLAEAAEISGNVVLGPPR
ncbi:cupin domain-containing protein [Lentzea sp. NBRC 102530]|uniref:cupin domain-containing protein n=1 Tax=Lentzea sp. NBRC 102530 TaxID=3032201 RepID=UPI00249FB422|nr:cupin domain-containing protein [Lentzea sp. NBRC 102530]GLY50487.1 cupin [Lentzea sp. NBRC 102530]